MAKTVRATLVVQVEIRLHEHVDVDWFCENCANDLLGLPTYGDVSREVGAVACVTTGVESAELVGENWPRNELTIFKPEPAWKRAIRRIRSGLK